MVTITSLADRSPTFPSASLMTRGLARTLERSHPSHRGTRARHGRTGRREGCRTTAAPTGGLGPAGARCPAAATISMLGGHRRALSIRPEKRLAMLPGDEPRCGVLLAAARLQRRSGRAGAALAGRQRAQRSGKRSRTRLDRPWRTASLPGWRSLRLSAMPGRGLASAGGRSTRARTISIMEIGLASCANCTSRFSSAYSPPASRQVST